MYLLQSIVDRAILNFLFSDYYGYWQTPLEKRNAKNFSEKTFDEFILPIIKDHEGCIYKRNRKIEFSSANEMIKRFTFLKNHSDNSTKTALKVVFTRIIMESEDLLKKNNSIYNFLRPRNKNFGEEVIACAKIFGVEIPSQI